MGKPGNIYSHTGLRGLAALYVVLHHLVLAEINNDFAGNNILLLLFQPGGYAVDLFFILSGFILNWVYLSESVAFNWASYFWARVARIMPLYYLTLLLFLILRIYSTSWHGVDPIGKDYPTNLLLNLFMVSGIVDAWGRTINTPAWSISVEFFCYLAVFPVLFRLNRYFAGKSYGIPLSIGLVGLSTFGVAASYAAPPVHIYHWVWDGSFLARGIFGFSSGFILCSIFRNVGDLRLGKLASDLPPIATVAILILVGFHVVSRHWLIGVLPVLVFFTAFDTGLAAAVLKTRPIQWLGERSYSIYLWHCIFLLHTVYFQNHFNGLTYCAIVMPMILVTSELSYRFFECPAREFIRRRFSRSAAGQRPALPLSRSFPST